MDETLDSALLDQAYMTDVLWQVVSPNKSLKNAKRLNTFRG